MEKKPLRALVFSSITTKTGSSAISDSLSPFAIVKQVNWRYKPIPKKIMYFFLNLFLRTFECFYWSLQLLHEICLLHPDIIIAQYAYFTGFIAAITAKISRTPCVIRAVGSDLKIDSQSLLGRCIVSWSLNNVSGVICVSKDLENIAGEFGTKSTVVIPSPLDLTGFVEKDNIKDWDIISIALLKPVKGISYLIKAIARINDLKLIIVGDGPERRDLESLSSYLGLNDRIFFQGMVDHSLIWDYLQRAKVFVLPSISEGCPRVLMEAMVCGLPIVATEVGGNPEVVVNGVNGFLVPPRDEEALAAAIKLVLKDNDLQKRISKENKEKAKKYSMQIIGERIYNYLKMMVDSQVKKRTES